MKVNVLLFNFFFFQFEIRKYCNGDHSEECDKYINSTGRIIFVPETPESESVDCHVSDGNQHFAYYFTGNCKHLRSSYTLFHTDEMYVLLFIRSGVLLSATFLLVLQIISAISSGITDISFDTVGYAWQFSNCILTASYSVSSNY